MVEVYFVTGANDHNLWCDFVSGLPMHGWARHSSTLMQRPSRPPGTEWDAKAIDKANRSVVHRVRSTGDPTTDIMAWDKILAEFANGFMQGPYYSLDELPAGQKRLVPRFPLLERHGGAIVDSCRVIDDCKIPNVNK